MRKTIKDLWQGCLSWGENVINQREMAEPIPIVQCDAGFENGIQRIRCTIIIIFRWKNKICNYIYIYDPNFILKWHIHARLEANTAKCYYLMGSLKEQDYKSFLFTRSKFPRFFFFFGKFLHGHLLHLKSEDCRPKIWEYCRNEAKTMKIFYGLWIASHPVPGSSVSWCYNLPIPTSHPKEPVKEEEGRRKGKREGERERTR